MPIPFPSCIANIAIHSAGGKFKWQLKDSGVNPIRTPSRNTALPRHSCQPSITGRNSFVVVRSAKESNSIRMYSHLAPFLPSASPAQCPQTLRSDTSGPAFAHFSAVADPLLTTRTKTRMQLWNQPSPILLQRALCPVYCSQVGA